METPKIPKIQTDLLRDPVAEFVAEADADGDNVPELPGGLHRVVMPSPRGGFFANNISGPDGIARNRSKEDLFRSPKGSHAIEEAPKKDALDAQFDHLVRKSSREDLDRLVIKDSIDGITPRAHGTTGMSTPRRDRAYDSLSSPRVASK